MKNSTQNNHITIDAAITFTTAASNAVRANDPELMVVEIFHPDQIDTLPIGDGVDNLLIVLDNTPNHRDAFARFVARMARFDRNIAGRCPKKAGATWADVLADLGDKSLEDGGEWIDCDKLLAQHQGSAHIKDLRGSQNIEDVMQYFNAQYFVAGIGGQTVVVHERIDPQLDIPVLDPFAPRDFFARYSDWVIGETKPDRICAACAWFRSTERRQYDSLIFDPTRNPDWTNRYNLFHGFPFQPVQGDSSVFWNHVREVICDGNETKYAFLRKWISHLLQKPEEKPSTAIVLQGLQGTGKTAFADVLMRLLGAHAYKADTVSRITGRFNSVLSAALFVYVDELNCNGRSQAEVMERLKSLTGNSTVNVEFKGKEPITLKNFSRVMMASNEETPLPLTPENRRFWLYKLSSARCNDLDYFARFVAETSRPEVLSAIMFDLLTEDLSSFKPNQPPDGQDAFEMVLESRPAAVRWLHAELAASSDGIFNRQSPDSPRSIPSNRLNAAWNRWCEREGVRCTFAAALKELRKFLPKLNTRRPASPRGDGIEFGQQRVRYYEFPSLTDCRRTFCRHFNLQSHNWDRDEED